MRTASTSAAFPAVFRSSVSLKEIFGWLGAAQILCLPAHQVAIDLAHSIPGSARML